LTDDDRWRSTEPPPSGPSTPPDLRFNPLATGIGVFAAVAIPIVVVGYTRASGPNTTMIWAGVIAGLLAGLVVGLWVSHRGGRV
jgi:high-affinity Fe2+/Pb2+ permease